MPRREATWTDKDKRFMEMAFAEARKSKGHTLPNPAVGAVLVKKGKVIGKGGTRPAGQAHAEIVALEKAGAGAAGSTLYVTLEPCSHHGRTPPCSDAVIAAGVARVVIAIRDANPLVSGDGIRALQKAGVEVEVDLMGETAAAFYDGFFFRIRRGRPKIILKIAQSLDGRINAGPGEETAITGEKARLWTHALRSRVDAILIGGRTLRVDDPDLTPRLAGGPVPEAIVLSRHGPFDPEARLFAQGRSAKTLVAGQSREGLPPWVDHFQVEANRPAKETVAALMSLFDQRGYHSVLVEGGREIWALFLNAGICDSLFILTAPKLLPGGEKWDSELGQDWGKSLNFHNLTALGSDFLTEFGCPDSNG